jgi:hypothetical protein
MDVVAGIVWDPREPLPPELHNIDAQPSHPPPTLQQGRGDFVIQEPTRNILPPFSVSLIAQVVQDTAKVTVTQLFWNNTNTAIRKGAYTFSLPAGCTVFRFSCRIGRNRIVRAKVKPRVEARESLDDAIRNNRTAALLEQETPEIFTTTLGNIPANARLKAEISYVTLLKHRFANYRSTTTLTIPTYIAARYGSPPPGFQNAITSGIPQGLTIVVEVAAAENKQTISSATHRITVQRRNRSESWRQFAAPGAVNDIQTTLVKLEGGSTLLDRDFILDITTQPEGGLEAPQAWLEIHPSIENHKAVMLTIPPKFMLRNQSTGQDAEILFVADRSGSMTDKMNSVKSAMNFFLKGIPRGRKFNIWCFGSFHGFLWPESRDYSEQTLQAALEFVSRQFEADMGGTELLPALKGIVAARDRSRMTNIVILTDGEVWRLDETISFVQQTRRETEGSVRFFALGIGNAVSHELVEGIAKAGGGYAEVIPAASQGGWDDRVVSMLHAALASHLGPLRIEFDQAPIEEAQGQQPLDGKIPQHYTSHSHRTDKEIATKEPPNPQDQVPCNLQLISQP